MKPYLYFGLICLGLIFSAREKTNAQSPDWLWTKSIGGKKSDAARSIVVDPENGDVYTTGAFSGTVDFDPGEESFYLASSGTSDVFITKLDGSGNFIWAAAIGGSDVAVVSSISLDLIDNRSVYITGSFKGTIDFDPGKGTFNLNSVGTSDGFIAKFDGSGYFVWAKAVGGPDAVYVLSIAIDPSGSGDIYTSGYFRGTIDFDPGPDAFNLTSAGSDDIFISKLDGDGTFLWARSFGGKGSDVSRCIAVDPAGSGEVCITGWFSGTADFAEGPNAYNITSVGRFDIFISKVDGSGNLLWAKQLGGTGVGDGAGSSVAIDPASGDIYTTGYFEGTADFDPHIKHIFNLKSSGLRDIFISKLDGRGIFLWARAIGGAGLDAGASIALDPAGSGDVCIAGYFRGTVDFDPGVESYIKTSVGPDDIFISKLDGSGDFKWVKAIRTTKEASAAMALDALGHIYVSGIFNSPTILFDSKTLTNTDPVKGTGDVFIAKLDLIYQSLALDSEEQQIEIFPNPTNDQLSIKLDKEESHDVEITLFNLRQELVFSSAANDLSRDLTFDISRLPGAVYILEVNDNGKRTVKQIVKVQE